MDICSWSRSLKLRNQSSMAWSLGLCGGVTSRVQALIGRRRRDASELVMERSDPAALGGRMGAARAALVGR